MQATNIQTLTNQAKNHLLNGQERILPTGDKNPVNKKRIGMFWVRMIELYSYKWSSVYGEKPSMASVWVELLNNLSDEHIEQGIKSAVNSGNEWPPTPIEFKNLCFGLSLKAIGLPDLDIAFNSALSGMYRHKVIKAAARETGQWELARATSSDSLLKKRFEYNYLEMAKRFANGESLEKPVTKALEHAQETASFGVADDLIAKGMQSTGSSGKSGYMAFLEAKKKVGGIR